MNPFAYPRREQAKAVVGGLGSFLTGWVAGDPVVAVIGGLISFYAVFATKNGS